MLAGFNYDSRANTLIIGTTRSGKTTAMLNIIEKSLMDGEPVFVISGKTGFNDEDSMYTQLITLCKRYGRKLYSVSTNRMAKNNVIYNPFKYADVIGISNTMTVMAQFSDTHYEANFEFWVICICEILERAGKQKSLPNIMKLYQWEKFESVVRSLKESGVLSDDEEEEYLSYKEIAQIASQARARFLRYIKGNGSSIFIGSDAVSVEDVKNEGAVFMMDLDGLMYKDYSYALGTMFVSDLRTMISNETDFKRKKLIVFDELSVFFSPLLPDIYSQASGFGYQSIAGSQSFADMDKISPDLAERIIENSHMFGFLLQNSAEDAERASRIIGTKKASEITRRKAGASYDDVGSSKVIDKYKVHPNVIKELEPLKMVYYDKTVKDKEPVILKVGYVT